ncbi:EF-P lysine aminoacylase EpmA [Thiohalomonas denitrificans]|uniref:Lysyl-tRNA synthetase, class 2 n=1 Tax=Thiohalomonas denitrificans TaxID=415747 RepID=A0A1G5PKG9_9GAMM|nr:EF-P lysine aminoacylase EpmA [Thiohalomonas denitrificans]SCZ50024.1 lysyl-tRNA synthetase, class 2 [Thiohalomonas denitrificans]
MDWRPAASLGTLQERARILFRIRAFFEARGVWEVDTPILSRAGTTDPHIDSFVSRYQGPGAAGGLPLYLHTSPEFPMKRLLAAGSGPIFQMAKVFRQGEAGRLHNPEFTLLEWYRPGFGMAQLMDEVEALVRCFLDYPAARRVTYARLFEEVVGLDPHRADVAQLAACACASGLGSLPDLGGDRDAWLHLLFSHRVEPVLEGLTFVHDYPTSQAALARIREGDPPVAERFELYVDGVELANGFHELSDAAEQRSRFAAERGQRRSAGQEDIAADGRLLQALEHGLPDCSGVALGVDRLVMRTLGLDSVADVIAFPVERA